MKYFLQYLYNEVKNKRLGKTEGIKLIRHLSQLAEGRSLFSASVTSSKHFRSIGAEIQFDLLRPGIFPDGPHGKWAKVVTRSSLFGDGPGSD